MSQATQPATEVEREGVNSYSLRTELVHTYGISDETAGHLVGAAIRQITAAVATASLPPTFGIWNSDNTLTAEAAEAVRLCVDRFECGESRRVETTDAYVLIVADPNPQRSHWHLTLHLNSRPEAIETQAAARLEDAEFKARLMLGPYEHKGLPPVGRSVVYALPPELRDDFMAECNRLGITAAAAHEQAVREWLDANATEETDPSESLYELASDIVAAHRIGAGYAAGVLQAAISEVARAARCEPEHLYVTPTRITAAAANAALHIIDQQCEGRPRILRGSENTKATITAVTPEHIGETVWAIEVFEDGDNTGYGPRRSRTATTLNLAREIARQQLADLDVELRHHAGLS